MRVLDRAEDQPRRVEHGARTVNGVGMDEGRPELRDLVGENADIAAGIEHGLVRVIKLTGKQVRQKLVLGAAHACALNGRGKA